MLEKKHSQMRFPAIGPVEHRKGKDLSLGEQLYALSAQVSPGFMRA
jgi:hypothetical protein